MTCMSCHVFPRVCQHDTNNSVLYTTTKDIDRCTAVLRGAAHARRSAKQRCTALRRAVQSSSTHHFCAPSDKPSDSSPAAPTTTCPARLVLDLSSHRASLHQTIPHTLPLRYILHNEKQCLRCRSTRHDACSTWSVPTVFVCVHLITSTAMSGHALIPHCVVSLFPMLTMPVPIWSQVIYAPCQLLISHFHPYRPRLPLPLPRSTSMTMTIVAIILSIFPLICMSISTMFPTNTIPFLCVDRLIKVSLSHYPPLFNRNHIRFRINNHKCINHFNNNTDVINTQIIINNNSSTY